MDRFLERFGWSVHAEAEDYLGLTHRRMRITLTDPLNRPPADDTRTPRH